MKKLICLGLILLCLGIAWADKEETQRNHQLISLTPYNILQDNLMITTTPRCDCPQSENHIEIKETPHTIRFSGSIMIGGEVELLYGDEPFSEAYTAFYKWLDSLTVKELRENWGIDFIKYREIDEGEKE